MSFLGCNEVMKKLDWVVRNNRQYEKMDGSSFKFRLISVLSVVWNATRPR